MPFTKIKLHNFRNLSDSEIDLQQKEIYFVGENGQGKSNLLEALYIASYGSSFRTKSDTNLVKEGCIEYKIHAEYLDNDKRNNTIYISYENKKKVIQKNNKSISDRKELIYTIPSIILSHDDLGFVVGSPEKMRWFIDQSISLINITYVDSIRKFRYVLKNRNLLLKNKNLEMLDIYDQKLVEIGLEIQNKRKYIIEEFNKLFILLFENITGISNVCITYHPSWKSYNIGEVIEILKKKRKSDLIMEITMSGPHRDHIIFMHNEKHFTSFASTGQLRLLSILLRIAQASFYTLNTQKLPVLLMDDVLLELDPDKRQKLTTLLPAYDQLFCTFLPGEPYERYKKDTTRIYFLKKGLWYE